MGPKLLFVLGIVVAHGALAAGWVHQDAPKQRAAIATCVPARRTRCRTTRPPRELLARAEIPIVDPGCCSRERGHHHDGRSHYSGNHSALRALSRTRTVETVSDDEDAQLMLAYARGEMRAFETLYSRHRGALYRYLTRQARDGEIANDLFQEVWSRVIVNRARYEPRAKFRTFLFTLAHNCFIDHCRRTKARPAGLRIEDADDADLLPAAEETQPDAALARDEASRRYRAALATLPAEQRDVYLLHEESDLSLEEIARITGVGAETAKSRLRYAVSKLKAALSVAEA